MKASRYLNHNVYESAAEAIASGESTLRPDAPFKVWKIADDEYQWSSFVDPETERPPTETAQVIYEGTGLSTNRGPAWRPHP